LSPRRLQSARARPREQALLRPVKNLIEILPSVLLIMRAFRHAGREAIRFRFSRFARSSGRVLDWKRDCGAHPTELRAKLLRARSIRGLRGYFSPQAADRLGLLISRLLLIDTRKIRFRFRAAEPRVRLAGE